MNILTQKRRRRATRNRAKLSGTSSIPRLSVFRSNTNLYAQLINDETGETLISASTLKNDKGSKTEQAETLGKELAELANKANISRAIMDRGPYRYHGRVKAVADAARRAGLTI